jgi:hypothetical protein
MTEKWSRAVLRGLGSRKAPRLPDHIRLYRVSNTKTGWKLLTKPSKEAVQKHREKMKQEWEAVRGWKLEKILWKFNPIIRGWANYYRTGTAKETFHKLDNWMFDKEVRHVKRTHPRILFTVSLKGLAGQAQPGIAETD